MKTATRLQRGVFFSPGAHRLCRSAPRRPWRSWRQGLTRFAVFAEASPPNSNWSKSSKRYGDITALGATSLTLRAGEIFSLVGETGSGKTTLAMIAAGVLQPDQGRRVFEGRDMDEWIKGEYRSLARKIGVVYQNPAEAVSHRFSVFDIVAEPLKIQEQLRDKEEIRKRVLRALSEVHLSTEPVFLGRYAHELNMGALQRVCIARALVSEPVPGRSR